MINSQLDEETTPFATTFSAIFNKFFITYFRFTSCHATVAYITFFRLGILKYFGDAFALHALHGALIRVRAILAPIEIFQGGRGAQYFAIATTPCCKNIAHFFAPTFRPCAFFNARGSVLCRM